MRIKKVDNIIKFICNFFWTIKFIYNYYCFYDIIFWKIELAEISTY